MVAQGVGATGVTYFGVLPFSSLSTEDGNQASFTVDDLMKLSHWKKTVSAEDRSIRLQNALVLDTIINANTHLNVGEILNTMGQEVVVYAVIHRAFTQFQTGVN
jgi:hypothetical protein